MGLFGLFYTVFVLGARGYKGIKDSIEDTQDREQARSEGRETYVGNDGIGRLTQDGRRTMYCYEYVRGYNEKPDYVLKYAGTKEIIRNLSQENREKVEKESYEEAIHNNGSVYRIGEKYDDHFGDKCRGFRYKDIKSGAVYVLRRVCGKHYYMSIKTALLIRKTDYQLEREKSDALNNPTRHQLNIKHDEEHIMEEFNHKQEEYAEKYGINFRNDLLTYE